MSGWRLGHEAGLRGNAAVKPSPESDSIFVPAPLEDGGPDSRVPAVGTGTLAGDSKAATIEPGPGTAVTDSKIPELGPRTEPVVLGTSSAQQVTIDSSPLPPSPAALVQVTVLIVDEIAAPSWAQPILKFLVNKELPTDETSARQVQCRAAAEDDPV